MRRWCVVFGLGVGLWGQPWAVAQGSPEVEETSVDYALTISGGVSLGAYEAGTNWALIKYMRTLSTDNENHRVTSVTGASAGNINTMLTAMAWCLDEDDFEKESVDNNLFAQSWIEIDSDKLLPTDQSHYKVKNHNPQMPKGTGFLYIEGKEEEGLLARGYAFEDIIDNLSSYFDKSYRTSGGCGEGLSLAVTVTSEEPYEDKTHPVKTLNQRLIVPWKAKVRQNAHCGDVSCHNNKCGEESCDSSLYFEPYTSTQADDLEQLKSLKLMDDILVLPYEEVKGEANREVQYQIPYRTIFRTVMASSAFPVGFGPIYLEHCTRQDFLREGECLVTSPWVRDDVRFYDGGVFDNIPLGAAISLQENTGSSNAKTRYIFVEPDSRRYPKLKFSDQKNKHGLDYYAATLGHLVGTARQQELRNDLQNYAATHPSDPLDIRPSKRFSSLTASHFANFSAFLDEPFRWYDYYNGVYDAVYSLSEDVCEAKPDVTSKDQRFACIGQTLRKIADQLEVSSSEVAWAVFQTLARADYSLHTKQNCTHRASELCRFSPSWAWVAPKRRVFASTLNSVEAQVLVVAKVVARRTLKCVHKVDCLQDDSDFDAFVQALEEEGYVAQSDNARTLFRGKIWYWYFLRNLSRRLDGMESEAHDGESSIGLRVSKVAQFVAETQLDQHQALVPYHPSSLPLTNWFWYWDVLGVMAPHYVGLPLDEVGVDVGWRFVSWSPLQVPYTQTRLYWSLGNTLNYQTERDLVLVSPGLYMGVKKIPWLFGGGPEFGVKWNLMSYNTSHAERTDVDLQWGVTLLRDKVGVRTTCYGCGLSDLGKVGRYDVFVTLEDFSGFVFWLMSLKN